MPGYKIPGLGKPGIRVSAPGREKGQNSAKTSQHTLKTLRFPKSSPNISTLFLPGPTRFNQSTIGIKKPRHPKRGKEVGERVPGLGKPGT